MVQLLSREEILKLNKSFTQFVLEVQNEMYNPSLPENRYEPQEMYVEDSEKPRYVSQEECDQWNKETQIEYERRRDKSPFGLFEKRNSDELIFSIPDNHVDSFIEKLTTGLEKICNNLNSDFLFFLLSYSTPWLYQDNDFPPVKNALDYIKTLGVTPEFNGGFAATGKELIVLIKNIFWIVRCNASLPIAYFTSNNNSFVGTICDRGNLHIIFYDEEEKKNFIIESQKLGFKIFSNGECPFNEFEGMGLYDGQEAISPK